MTAFKCSMCGAPIEVTEGVTEYTCDFCGTRQEGPKSEAPGGEEIGAIDYGNTMVEMPISDSINIDDSLRKAFSLLEEGEWIEADTCCDEVLKLTPENAQAYLGKLMVECMAKKPEDLANYLVPFDNSENYQMALQYGDDQLKDLLEDCVLTIKTRNTNARGASIYDLAVLEFEEANSEQKFRELESKFKSISGYLDADEKAAQCAEKVKECIYDSVVERMNKSALTGKENENELKHKLEVYRDSKKKLENLSGFQDADEKVVQCANSIVEIGRMQQALAIKHKQDVGKLKKMVVIAVGCICLLIVISKVMDSIEKKNKYDEAVKLLNEGNIVEAYDAFSDLDGYKDSSEQAVNLWPEYEREKIKAASVGDKVYFGTYNWDDDESNGLECIQWRVLEKEEDRVLLITDNGIDCQPYDTSGESVSWEKCSLRKWLNETFLESAFSEEESSMIWTTSLTTKYKGVGYITDGANSYELRFNEGFNKDTSFEWGETGGGIGFRTGSFLDYDSDSTENSDKNKTKNVTTKDKIFLLSTSEAEKYFTDDESRKSTVTKYAYNQGVYLSDDETVVKSDGEEYDTCEYWLRSQGSDYAYYAACVSYDGSIDDYGNDVDDDDIAVRPALWISIE